MDSLTISDQSICGSISGCRSHFHRHVRRHTGLPRYICSKCYVCFAEFINFKEHFTWSLVKDCQNVVKFNGTGIFFLPLNISFIMLNFNVYVLINVLSPQYYLSSNQPVYLDICENEIRLNIYISLR